MKRAFSKLLIMAAVSLLLFACNQAKEHKGEVDIKDARNGADPVPELTAHKPFDVEVYRVALMNSAYKIIYYQNEDGAIKSHGAMYADTLAVYNKAAYHWVNDTVCVRLYNDSSRQEAKFRLYGKGSSNGMMDDK